MPQPALGFSILPQIPRAIWALGLVSLLMDISSEMIHSLLPVYLVTALGASMVTVGIIEGIAEATASITKVFSGALSDWLGKRKLLAVIGYGLAAFTKPVFPMASTVAWLVFPGRSGLADERDRPGTASAFSRTSSSRSVGVPRDVGPSVSLVWQPQR